MGQQIPNEAKLCQELFATDLRQSLPEEHGFSIASITHAKVNPSRRFVRIEMCFATCASEQRGKAGHYQLVRKSRIRIFDAIWTSLRINRTRITLKPPHNLHYMGLGQADASRRERRALRYGKFQGGELEIDSIVLKLYLKCLGPLSPLVKEADPYLHKISLNAGTQCTVSLS